MALRDDLRPASFRGVPFGVLSTGATGLARRAEVHEYPKRDRPYVEDLGRQTAGFTVTAFVRWADSARLIEACGEAGPGRLVHPLLGDRDVVCTGCDVDESTRSIGVSQFSLTFVEAGANTYPGDVPNTGKQTASAAEAARGVLRDSFLAQFARRAAPQWVTDLSVGWAKSAADAIQSAAQLVPGANDLAHFNLAQLALGSDTAGLIAGNRLGLSLSDSLQRLAGLATDPLAALRMFEGLGSFGDTFEAFAETTFHRKAAADRRNAITRMVRRSAAVEGAQLATTMPLDSYDASVTLRDRVVALLEPEIVFAGDHEEDEVLAALTTLLAIVNRDLRERGGELARVRKIVLPAPVPAVVLAFQLYGDATRDEDLVARNRIRHPLFCPGGRALEVLSA